MSVVTTIGHIGVLLAPSVIGFVAARTGLGPVYITLGMLIAAMSVLSGLAALADASGGGPD